MQGTLIQLFALKGHVNQVGDKVIEERANVSADEGREEQTVHHHRILSLRAWYNKVRPKDLCADGDQKTLGREQVVLGEMRVAPLHRRRNQSAQVGVDGLGDLVVGIPQDPIGDVQVAGRRMLVAVELDGLPRLETLDMEPLPAGVAPADDVALRRVTAILATAGSAKRGRRLGV